MSTECEFYLFKTDAAGEPTMTPHDRGGFDDIAPLDKGENIRREICLALEEMGLRPECSHHERGPGQHEVDFRYADALSAADNFITFKMAVKAIAAQNGLFASFMPKPLADCDGNGLHINLVAFGGQGMNLFRRGDSHSPVAESFIAGILSRATDMTALLNPIPNSYSRLAASTRRGTSPGPTRTARSSSASAFGRRPCAHGTVLGGRRPSTRISRLRYSSTRDWTASKTAKRSPRPAAGT